VRFTVSHPPIPRSRPLAVAVAFTAILFIAAFDFITGPGISVAVLYLLPIAGLSWVLRWRWGLAAAALAAALSFATDLSAHAPTVTGWIPYWNALVQFGVFAGAAVTLSALRGAMQREREASRHDYLTHLANWRAFAEACEDELARLRRFSRPLTLVYMDCDHFKQVNDTLGHSVGDELLRRVGEALAETVREVDTVARLGGDEFVVLLPETDAEAAAIAVERLREALAATISGGGWDVTMSLGAATFVQPPASIDELVATADRLMYEAKRGGRDRAVLRVFGEPAV
jgi:diguanylate cyclase (GGDEF)-like protein